MITRYLSALAVAGSLVAASAASAAPLVRPSCGGETKKPEGTPPKAAAPTASADQLCGGPKGGNPPPTEPPKS